MMLIAERFRFVHVPRCGGTWTTAALRQAGMEIEEIDKHLALRKFPRPDLPLLAFVREPLGWYKSIWRHYWKHKTHFDTQGNFSLLRDQPDIRGYCNGCFDDFIVRITNELPGCYLILLREMLEFDAPDFAGQIRSFDTLPWGLIAALSAFGVEVDADAIAMPAWRNAGDRRYPADYTARTRELVIKSEIDNPAWGGMIRGVGRRE